MPKSTKSSKSPDPKADTIKQTGPEAAKSDAPRLQPRWKDPAASKNTDDDDLFNDMPV